jgi:multisubunit Na+/H+ antiporter MnhB subunit
VTTLEQPDRQRRGRRSRRDVVARAILVVVGLALAFLLGIAFARTLDERPKPSGPETIVRTLSPLQQEAPVRTMTVTLTGP